MIGLFLNSVLLIAANVPPPPQACAFDKTTEKVVASPIPQVEYEAGNREVFKAESFDFGGETYVKFGNPRPFTPAELRGYAKMVDALLFIDVDFNEEILYVLTSSAGCMFQPYFRKESQ